MFKLINSVFPNSLYKVCRKKSIRVVHLSTDCVFSGKEGNYSEDYQHDGSSIYSKSRSLGEFYNNKDIIINQRFM